MQRPPRDWQIGTHSIRLGERTWLMAVLNLTPDSFYPASRLAGREAAVEAAEKALAEGAGLLDLGAESTRPGSQSISPAEEQARLLPALEAIRRRFPAALLSVDTRHATTAAAALAAGAAIVNDVSGLALAPQAPDHALGELIAATACGAVLMHSRGDFATMHQLPPLADPLSCVQAGFRDLLARAHQFGIRPEQIVLDPGFGFGKNLDENVPLLAHLAELHVFGRPLLVGVSRKSFLGHLLGGRPPEDRLHATVAAVTAAILAGAHIVRVHDVAAARDAALVADALLAAG